MVEAKPKEPKPEEIEKKKELKKNTMEVDAPENKKSALQVSIIRLPLKSLEKAFIARQLSVMLSGGLTTPEALEALQDQTKKKSLKKIIEDVLKSAMDGKSLEQALRQYDKEFGEMFIQVVAAGETGGNLEENLSFLGEHFRKQNELKQSIQGALSYPLIVLGMLVAMAAAAVLFIFPSFKSLFDAFGDMEIPFITQVFLNTADWIGKNALIVGVIIVVTVVSLIFLLRVRRFKTVWDKYMIRLPLIGKLFWYSALSQFTHIFGALLSGGVPVTVALEVTSKSVGNAYIQKIAKEAEQQVQRGVSLTDALKPYENTLTTFLMSMLQTGEKSGKLEENLIYIGEYYSEELKHTAEALPTLIGPAMLITVGAAVALFALSIILPLYKATSAIQFQ